MKTDFYVYLYFRLNGQPLYIGKGRGRRWQAHKTRNCNIHLRNVIDQARAADRELPIVFLHENLDERTALEYEKALIVAIGREVHGGPLCNQTDGGEGMSGFKQSAETRAKRSRSMKGVPKTREHAMNAANARKATGWKPSPEHMAKAWKAASVPATPERIAKIKATVNSPERREQTLRQAAHARRALAEKRASDPASMMEAARKAWDTRRERGVKMPKWTAERRAAFEMRMAQRKAKA